MITLATDGTLALDLVGGSSDPIRDRMLLSLMTVRGSMWQRPDFGRAKPPRKQVLASLQVLEQDARDALAWMVEADMIAIESVAVTSPWAGRVDVAIRATRNGRSIEVAYWFPVPTDPR